MITSQGELAAAPDWCVWSQAGGQVLGWLKEGAPNWGTQAGCWPRRGCGCWPASSLYTLTAGLCIIFLSPSELCLGLEFLELSSKKRGNSLAPHRTFSSGKRSQHSFSHGWDAPGSTCPLPSLTRPKWWVQHPFCLRRSSQTATLEGGRHTRWRGEMPFVPLQRPSPRSSEITEHLSIPILFFPKE